jgi:hypothetical protein
MHGHPFPGPLQLWWGSHSERSRNIFKASGEIPHPTKMFRAGGEIDEGGRIRNRGALHALMKALAERIRAEPEPTKNSGIPSGYTYLLQFIAHDMIDSVVSFSAEGGALSPGSRNARSASLLLDTLYGPGPDECPHAYQLGKRIGHIPRTHLRLGARHQRVPAGNNYCPYQDIARGKVNSLDRAAPSGDGAFWEAMIADPRNDAHALISQLTVLFQLLHNHVISLIERHTSDVRGLPPRELAYRQFRCARLVVTAIYRNIIEHDVLERILDWRVFQHYVKDRKPLFDTAEGLPLEFGFGAFRFAHTMVRDRYAINAEHRSQETGRALELSSLQPVSPLPVEDNWFIDWAHFFDVDIPDQPGRTIALNLSAPIGPHYPKPLEAEFEFEPKVPAIDAGGLAHLDLLSSCYAGVMSVPAILDEARGKGFGFVGDFEDYRPTIVNWLCEHPQFKVEDPATSQIANDPPLPFFVLFEAARIGKDEVDGGKSLGPIGSIIIAETILGAMRQHKLDVEGLTLKSRMAACGRLLFEHQASVAIALEAIDEISTMPQLLSYMRRMELFAVP